LCIVFAVVIGRIYLDTGAVGVEGMPCIFFLEFFKEGLMLLLFLNKQTLHFPRELSGLVHVSAGHVALLPLVVCFLPEEIAQTHFDLGSHAAESLTLAIGSAHGSLGGGRYAGASLTSVLCGVGII